MEPQLSDFYNSMPHGINVIDKMNEELSDLQAKYGELMNMYIEYVRTHTEETHMIPKIRIQTINEFKTYGKKIFDSIPELTTIIYNFLNHTGWILEYDPPDELGLSIMGCAGCGFWDNWEGDVLTWGNTSAQQFYYGDHRGTEYNLYLKCKLLEELYRLFPEYKKRGKGWFHKIIDEAFNTIGITISTMLEYDCKVTKQVLHDMIYRIIMEKLFGWGKEVQEDGGYGVFPLNYTNRDYLQNIIYYQCETCKKVFHGEDAMEEDKDVSWFYEDGNLCMEPCRCL